MGMNRYGCSALAYGRQRRPRQYGTLPDPLAFFTNLGERAERQAGEQSDATVLAGTPAGGETDEQRSRRALSSKNEAEQAVLREVIRPPAAFFPDDGASARDHDSPPPPS
ncbi:hypothetical protein ACIBMX_10785 [Streptomyces phaeochromogenes]|uniref:hypothetical protein n=1 Tax=Streptomyces phaeochromogenes TaxID=1923 RepID=UPI0033E83993